MEYLGVILSSNSINSPWVEKEVDIAMNQEISGKTIKVLPLLLDDCQLPGFLEGKLYADFRNPNNYFSGLGLIGNRLGLKKSAESTILSASSAESIIQSFSELRRIKIGHVSVGLKSALGTYSYTAKARDGMGAIYCHASGPLKGQTFYVRKGIGIVYEQFLNENKSKLGLPVSNEELVDGKGYPTSFFENGFIEWSPDTWIAKAVLYTPDGDKVIWEGKV